MNSQTFVEDRPFLEACFSPSNRSQPAKSLRNPRSAVMRHREGPLGLCWGGPHRLLVPVHSRQGWAMDEALGSLSKGPTLKYRGRMTTSELQFPHSSFNRTVKTCSVCIPEWQGLSSPLTGRETKAHRKGLSGSPTH